MYFVWLFKTISAIVFVHSDHPFRSLCAHVSDNRVGDFIISFEGLPKLYYVRTMIFMRGLGSYHLSVSYWLRELFWGMAFPGLITTSILLCWPLRYILKRVGNDMIRRAFFLILGLDHALILDYDPLLCLVH